MGSRATVLVLVAAAVAHAAPAVGASMILATSTSTENSGLLDLLVPQFEKAAGVEVKVIAVGTGAALRMAQRGQADAVLTHAPKAERPLVDAGDLTWGRRIMHNDFILVGPPDDPAGARGGDLHAAVRAIARHGAFVSRGDQSGTHLREMEMWKNAGVDPARIPRREETGQGQGATLDIASERRSYALTDRGTYLALRDRLDLVPIFEGDPSLRNVYSAYATNPDKHPGVNAEAARKWVDFLVAPATQAEIGAFRRAEMGRSLFVPDAVPASE